MRRVFKDVISLYSDMDSDIYDKCADDYEMDYSDEAHYVYDFNDGFVVFASVGDNVFFANCGFLNSKGAMSKCKRALESFLQATRGLVGREIYAKVELGNRKSSHLISALGFQQVYKIYSYEDN